MSASFGCFLAAVAPKMKTASVRFSPFCRRNIQEISVGFGRVSAAAGCKTKQTEKKLPGSRFYGFVLFWAPKNRLPVKIVFFRLENTGKKRPKKTNIGYRFSTLRHFIEQKAPAGQKNVDLASRLKLVCCHRWLPGHSFVVRCIVHCATGDTQHVCGACYEGRRRGQSCDLCANTCPQTK